jgi:DNA-binding protein HU-beta
MNRAELIDAIAKNASLTKVDAKKFLDAFLKVTSATLIVGEKVTLFRFGSFSVVERVAKTGHNPKTGEILNLPAKKVVKFRPSSELNDKVK